VIIAQDTEDAEYMLRKLVEEYRKWELHINFWKSEYLTLDPGAGIVTETGQIKAVSKLNTWDPFWKPLVQLPVNRGKKISEGR
jgi:hypothetical protein